MPQVIIGAQARNEAQEARQNEAFVWALKTTRARLGKTYTETAEAVGISRNSLISLKNPNNLNGTRFGSVRRIAHEIGMTSEEWLRLGGFIK